MLKMKEKKRKIDLKKFLQNTPPHRGKVDGNRDAFLIPGLLIDTHQLQSHGLLAGLIPLRRQRGRSQLSSPTITLFLDSLQHNPPRQSSRAKSISGAFLVMAFAFGGLAVLSVSRSLSRLFSLFEFRSMFLSLVVFLVLLILGTSSYHRWNTQHTHTHPSPR